jgi:hypothetical protein
LCASSTIAAALTKQLLQMTKLQEIKELQVTKSRHGGHCRGGGFRNMPHALTVYAFRERQNSCSSTPGPKLSLGVYVAATCTSHLPPDPPNQPTPRPARPSLKYAGSRVIASTAPHGRGLCSGSPSSASCDGPGVARLAHLLGGKHGAPKPPLLGK